MHDPDALLGAALREWVDSLPPGTATLAPVPPTTGGGGGYRVTPTRDGAVPIQLWVGDDPEHFAVSVGSSARWEQLPLSAGSVEKLCASVACGGFLEEAWKLGPLTLARRASLILGGEKTLQWATRGPFLLVPFSRWVRRAPEPWLG